MPSLQGEKKWVQAIGMAWFARLYCNAFFLDVSFGVNIPTKIELAKPLLSSWVY
jgi:hypothetical protein